MANSRVELPLDWKQFLELGEELLDRATVAEQVTLIQDTIDQWVGGKTAIWLARPFFPLPGQPEIPLLENDAPALVRQAFEKHKTCKKAARPCDPAPLHGVAVPLITQDYVLGVVLVERSAEQPFSGKEIDLLNAACSQIALALQITRQVVLKNWRFEQLALVRSVSAQVANIFDLNQLCQQVSQLIQESFHYYSVSIYTLDLRDGQLHLRGNAREAGCNACSPTLTIAAGIGMIGYAALTGNDLVAQDVTLEEHYRHMDALPETQSEASIALKTGTGILGVLDIQMDKSNAFHEIDLMVLRALADHIALAVEGTRLYSDLRWRAEQVEAVSQVSHALSSILDFDDLMHAVVEVIQKRFNYPYVHLFTTHPGRRMIEYVTGSGELSDQIVRSGLQFDMDAPMGLIPAAVRNQQMLLVNDVSKIPYYLKNDLPPANTCAELVIPLIFRDQVLGVLDIQSDQPNVFDEDQLPLFEALGASIAISLRNATLFRSESWRRQVADSFRDVATLLSANTALDELLVTILEKLESNLPCDAAAIWLLDEPGTNGHTDASQLKLAAVRGVEAGQIQVALREKPEVSAWLEKAMRQHEPAIRVPDEPYGPVGAALNLPGEHSSIAVPLRAGEQILGVLTMVHRTSGRYGSETRAMTTTFGSYAAVAIQNARLYAATQEQAWIATVMLQVTEAAQAIRSLDELLDTIARLTPLLVGVNKCAIFLWDEEQESFEWSSHYGIEAQQGRRWFEASLPAFDRLRSHPGPVFIADPASELDLPEAAVEADGTLLLLPLLARGEILGAFLIGHQPGAEVGIVKTFSQHNLSILQGIAQQTAVAVENIHLIETRQEEAYVTAVLLQVAQAVVSQNNINDILDTIVHLLPILVGIDTCVIYLWDRDQGVFYAAQAYGKNLEEDLLAGLTYAPQDFALLNAVRSTDGMAICRQPFDSDAIEGWSGLTCLPTGEIPNARQSATSNWLLGFPLSVKGEVYGVLVTREAGAAAAFHERRLELVNGVAQQVALALQNERLKEEMVRASRLEREIQLARQIQQTFLPDHLPVVPHWEMDIRWETARQVGGDFYDIFKLGKGRLGMVIADVSDKGLPAALYMTVTRTLIRAYMHTNESPARVLEKVNNLLLSDAQNSMFVTAVYAILSLESGQLTYTNAGHNRPLLLRNATGSVEQLPKGGMALGVMEDSQYQDHILSIEPCDTLLLYTDGLTEAFSSDGETFGEERLNSTLATAACGSVKDLLEKLDQILYSFRKGNQPSDDLTVVALRRKPLQESSLLTKK